MPRYPTLRVRLLWPAEQRPDQFARLHVDGKPVAGSERLGLDMDDLELVDAEPKRPGEMPGARFRLLFRGFLAALHGHDAMDMGNFAVGGIEHDAAPRRTYDLGTCRLELHIYPQ